MGITAGDDGHSGGCAVCGGRLKRNGKTSAGRTRWRCVSCGASSTRSRSDLVRKSELDAFTGWLLGPADQGDTSLGSARSFRRRTAWCWQVEPTISVTGQIYDEVQIDGIYLRSNWCCLVAIAEGKVIAWQWCDREKTVAWRALLDQVPPPRVVVCDGGTGLPAALEQAWPDTLIQHCLVHVVRNVRTQLTRNPRTDAGKSLWSLTLTLTKITAADQAHAWLDKLNSWHQIYGHLTRERTYAEAAPTRPPWVKAGHRWWYHP